MAETLRTAGRGGWQPIYIVLWQDGVHLLPQGKAFRDRPAAERFAARQRGQVRTDWLRQ